jgi:hypothetical protein
MVHLFKKKNIHNHNQTSQDFYKQINEKWILQHQHLTSKKPFVNAAAVNWHLPS